MELSQYGDFQLSPVVQWFHASITLEEFQGTGDALLSNYSKGACGITIFTLMMQSGEKAYHYNKEKAVHWLNCSSPEHGKKFHPPYEERIVGIEIIL